MACHPCNLASYLVFMKTIVKQLKNGKVLLSDGAWGTLMQEQGLVPGECPELWCLEKRDVILQIAQDYISAGCDMIKTNSFGANRFKLEHYGLSNRVSALNHAAASISREAAGPDKHVIASVGPTGKFLITGEVSNDELYDAFKEQLQAIESGGADACCIETFSALDEGLVAVRAAKEQTELEIICTFTFEKTQQNDFRTMMGVSPTQMAVAMAEAGADIIGANCGKGIEQMTGIIREIREAVPLIPIIAHPNAGLPVNINGQSVFPEPPETMAEKIMDLIDAGANIIGGCCGTTPAHIREIAKQLNKPS